jgi:uncharacterized protein (DUF305 family)
MTHTRRGLALPTALAGTLILASCGTSSNGGHDVSGLNGRTTGAPIASGTQTTGPKNAADVAFATMMIPPEVQAVAMADMAVKQGTDTTVKALAPKIKTAQGPQIARMSGWLTGWGAPVPGGAAGQGMSGMSGMGGQTGGMMSGQEMTDLGRASPGDQPAGQAARPVDPRQPVHRDRTDDLDPDATPRLRAGLTRALPSLSLSAEPFGVEP